MTRVLYTIGHSVHSLDRFLELLRVHGVSAIGDVRSQPYSRRSPHFNQEALCAELERDGIAYVFLGDVLGGRAADPRCYDHGRVDYQRVAATPGFRQGLERLTKGIEQFRVALLCAEQDPLSCHRTILVCRNMRTPDLSILHILNDGRVEPHDATELRLLQMVGLSQDDLFTDRAELLERAYDLRGQEIAYALPEAPAAEAR